MPHTAAFLMSAEAASQRKSRQDGYKVLQVNFDPKFVVWAETKSDMFVELDADSVEHATNIAKSWVDNMNAMSASIRKVNKGGKLTKKCIAIVGPEFPDSAFEGE